MILDGKKALVTGVYGQDGSYLAELLVRRGLRVHGISRPRLKPLAVRIRRHLQTIGVSIIEHSCDLLDQGAVSDLMRDLQPNYCFHTAATHFSSEQRIGVELDQPSKYFLENIIPGVHLLEAARQFAPDVRMVLAGSCLMFDQTKETPQTLGTRYESKSLYGLAKIGMAEVAACYRARYGLHVATAILYNHESPRRADDFLTKKIAQNVARIRRGEITSFTLHDLSAVKDWGYAPDYAEAMIRMALLETPKDLIVASGTCHTVADLVRVAFRSAGIDKWKDYVDVKPFTTASSVRGGLLIGDSTDTRRLLDWVPSLSFNELVERLVESAINEDLS